MPTPRLTEEDFKRNNWQKLTIDQIKPDDQLYKTLDVENNDWWVGDSEGNLVPASVVNNWLNSYERQTPYQEQNDIATAREVELNQQHKANQEFSRQMDNFWGFNWMYPSQILGAFNPAGDNRDVPFAQRLFLGTGNTGAVSHKFAEEHPYLATGANLLFDIAAPGALLKGVPEMYNATRYNPYMLSREMNKALRHSSIKAPALTPNYRHKWGDLRRNLTNPLLDTSYESGNVDLSLDSPIIDKYLYGLLISGQDMLGLPRKFQRGLNPEVIEYLMKNKVGRDMKALEEAGAAPKLIKQKANQLERTMKRNVHVGEYSGEEYAKAGKEHTGGMFFEDRDFISINRDSGFPKNFVQKHEGTHLLDKYHTLTENQQAALDAAYDTGFEMLPELESSSDWLKGYDLMKKEKVTTNRDARDILLGDYQKFDIHVQNLIIDKMPDEKIIEAVREANGYGRNYINFLENTGGLTPEKIQQFREAMKKVGISAGIVAGTAEKATTNSSTNMGH